MAAAKSVQLVPFLPSPAPSRYNAPHSHYTFDALRKFMQGAGSAMLIFSGADSVSNSATLAASGEFPAIDFSSLDGLLRAVVEGPFSGHAQIIAAAMLFLAAGRCIARFFGLAVAAAVIFLYMQGVTIEDTLSFLDHFAQRLSAAARAFQTAEVG